MPSHDVARARLDPGAWPRMAVIGIMCMAQVFPYLLVNTTIPTIFRAEGLDLKSFTAFSLLTVPAWIKFLWAPLVDAHGNPAFGMRKSWILPCTLGAAASILLLAFFPPSPANLGLVVALLLLHMLIMATQDTAVDAYTLENLRPSERGIGSSVKVLFEAIGEAVALGGLMFVYANVAFGSISGWTATLLTAAVLLLLFTAPVIIRREPPLDPHILARRAAGDRPRLMKFVKRADTPFISLLLLLGGFLNFMLAPLAGPMLIDAGFSLVEVGVILGGVMPIAAPLGAISAGVLITRFGMRWMIAYLPIVSVAAFMPIVLLASRNFSASGAWGAAASAIASVVPSWEGGPRVVLAMLALLLPYTLIPQFHMLFTVSRMEWSSRSQAGTDFTSHGALYNIGRTASAAVSPLVASALGWSAFLCCIGVCAVVVALVYRGLFARVRRLVQARHEAELEPNGLTRMIAE